MNGFVSCCSFVGCGFLKKSIFWCFGEFIGLMPLLFEALNLLTSSPAEGFTTLDPAVPDLHPRTGKTFPRHLSRLGNGSSHAGRGEWR